MIKNVSIIYELKREKSNVIEALRKYLKEKNINFLINKVEKGSQLIITLGGDGLLLYAARNFFKFKIPILGINLGGLGFLAEIEKDRLFDDINNILSQNYNVEERTMLIARLKRKEKVLIKALAINDFVIRNTSFSRVIELVLKINGQIIGNYLGDGIIIATPTGSTAYSLAAGGPIIYPTIKSIIITPICPHSLTLRPLVIPLDNIVEIKVCSKKAFLTGDGQEEYILQKNDTVEIKESKYKVKLVTSFEKNYFTILKTKFKWAQR